MILKLVIMNGGNMINKEKSIAGLDTKKCLSCRSCFLTCPKNAIEMRENREGFFYPIINEMNCYRLNYNSNDTPLAKRLSQQVITLPLYADMSIETVQKICKIIKE